MKEYNGLNKANITSYIIALGLILLFAGNGSSLNLADNFVLFLFAIIVGIVRIDLKGFYYCVRDKLIFLFLVGVFLFTLILGLISPYSDAGTVKTMLMYPVLLLVILGTNQNEIDIRVIEHGAIISACIFSVLVIFFGDYYLAITTGKYTYEQSFGKHIIFEPNYLALFISLGFELSIIILLDNIIEKGNVINRVIYIVAAVISLIAMFNTGARMTVVAVIIFGLTYAFFIKNRKMKRRIIILIVLLLVLLILAINLGLLPDTMVTRLFRQTYVDGSNLKRVADWEYGFQAMIENPFGYGPTTTASIIQNMFDFHGDAHNTFITFGLFYGIIGLIAFVVVWTYTMIKMLKNKEYGYFSLLMSMLFQANVLAAQCTITLWIVLLLSFMKMYFICPKKDV